MLKRTLWFLTLCLLIVPLLSACGDNTATSSTGASATTASTGATSAAAGATTSAAAAGAATTTTSNVTSGATPAASGSTTGAAAGTTSAPANSTDKLMAVSGAQTGVTVRNFNPFSQTALLGALNMAYEPLMIVNGATGENVPWLATAYKLSDDAKSLSFTLREGVQWSDGQPFTANDVAFTFNLLRTKPGLQGGAVSAMNPQGGYVDTVTATDAKTVVFTFKQPFSPAFYDLAGQVIVPEHIWKDIADPSKFTNENPVGTGPFTEITNFTPQQYEIHRNPHYWQADKISFGGFKVTQGLTGDAAALAVTNGNYDWTGGAIPNIDQTYVAKDPANRGYWNPLVAPTISLVMLTTLKPFDDVNVRKAISMAINRKQIASVGMQNTTHPADVTGLNDGFKAWKVADPSKLGNWTDYNLDQANQMLDAAGLKRGSDGVRVLPDGTAMKYELNVIQGFTDWTRSADIIVQNLKAAGISISVKPLDFGTYFNNITTGNFTMIFGVLVGATPYQVYRLGMSASTTAPVGKPANQGNYSRFTSPKADELLQQWTTTVDPAKQKDISAQLQQLYADNAPILPLFPQPFWEIYKTTNFTGFPTKDNPYALGTIDGANNNMLLVFTHIKPK